MPPKETATAKKKSANSKTFSVDDVVTYKMRGYPAWPGKIVNPDNLTRDVLKEKPRQGTFYCIKFYPKGDYAWAPARDLAHLNKTQIDSYISDQGKKKGELLTGYQTAADPADWEAEQEELLQAKKEAEEGVDELEDGGEEDEGEDEKAATGSKRKAGGEKAKASTKKAKTEKKPAAPKKSAKVKSAATVESEDDEPSTSASAEKPKAKPKSAAASKAAATKASKKAAAAEKEKEKGGEEEVAGDDADSQKVKDWRHKLQRAFLTPKSPPSEEAMAEQDVIFTTIEEYSSMTIQQLQTSKIGKVMRKIAALQEIPRDDEFKFRERANTLMSKWQTQLSSAGEAEDGPAPAAATSSSKKNGNAPAAEAPKEDVEMAEAAPAAEEEEAAAPAAEEENGKAEEKVEEKEEDKVEEEKVEEEAAPASAEDAPMDEDKDAEGEKDE